MTVLCCLQNLSRKNILEMRSEHGSRSRNFLQICSTIIRNLVSWIVLLVIAVILAGAGAVFVWKSKDKKTEE